MMSRRVLMKKSPIGESRFRLIVTTAVLIFSTTLLPAVMYTGESKTIAGVAGKHIDIRIKQFPDLFFSSVMSIPGSENLPKIDGFSQVVEAAKSMQDIIRV